MIGQIHLNLSSHLLKTDIGVYMIIPGHQFPALINAKTVNCLGISSNLQIFYQKDPSAMAYIIVVIFVKELLVVGYIRHWHLKNDLVNKCVDSTQNNS